MRLHSSDDEAFVLFQGGPDFQKKIGLEKSMVRAVVGPGATVRVQSPKSKV